MMTMHPQGNYTKREKVLFGIDNICLQAETYQQVRFGLVTNNAAKTSSGVSSRTALQKARFNIVKLFSPEHGLTAKGEDGAYQASHIDEVTGLPVVSLYGNRLMPAAEDMDDIDAMLFDIPDAGCRFYTYVWTMTHVMEACTLNKKPLIILDRPNPLSGDIEIAEGPMLDEGSCSSFIGKWKIPIRHSCTLGELATFFAATRIKNLQLTVIKILNWNRKLLAGDAGWSFSPTSPAIPGSETALCYAGMGLLEGINVNEGRGTDQPFKIAGAPWIDAQQINTAFNDLQLAGSKSIALHYIPADGLYKGETCHGLKFSITDRYSFRPVETGLKLLQLIITLYPEKSAERLYPTVANPNGKGHLDKLLGVAQSFEKIKKGELISPGLQKKDWEEIVQPYLLY